MANYYAPPPPPPPPPQVVVDSAVQETLLQVSNNLEQARCLEAEYESSVLLASVLLLKKYNHKESLELSDTTTTINLPPSVMDALHTISEASLKQTEEETAAVVSGSSSAIVTSLLVQQQESNQKKDSTSLFKMGRGQLGKAVYTASLSGALHRATELSNTIRQTRAETSLQKMLLLDSSNKSSWMTILDKQLAQLRDYHARHDVVAVAAPIRSKRPRLSNIVADGYDLASNLQEQLSSSLEQFSPEEVLGKYLDLTSVLEVYPFMTEQNKKLELHDFLVLLSNGLSTTIPESNKLSERKKYVRFLNALQDYLEGFLKRTLPLLVLEDTVIQPALADFTQEWRTNGGVSGWELKPAEASWVDHSAMSSSDQDASIDLSSYESPEQLLESFGADKLKTELSKLGLKCGGTPLDRAKRLFLVKDTPLDELPQKLFVKRKAANDSTTTSTPLSSERRVDIARQEVVVTALLDQLRPTLEATIRRCERRETQTMNEREQELEEELHGSQVQVETRKENDSDEDSDEEDAPIYNPKGVPLGWDGKPIPYWLFKLHGLNHFYPCEICGNESYRGRRNFEKHFNESKHAFGMKCLGIPNTKHFHGVTKIEDAQQLWNKLQTTLDKDQFDGTKEEEYEDSLGNVLSRATYEDLARQGLL